MPRDIKGYPRALSFQNQRLVKDEERGSCPLHVLLLPCRNFEDPGGGSSKEGKMRDSLHPPSSTQSDLRASSPSIQLLVIIFPQRPPPTPTVHLLTFPQDKFPPLAQFPDLTLCSLKCPDFF